ncbi:hypothetical protein [Pontibacillus yanchengensis]|uniref:Uncharacterized protein n=1 Tax=Pontibacillus yanchengensis Y32 TaxID=1385514 RepID=A0A0A2TIF9_9BACI|nr:hypothetical protein [Pontibacillus yanchengensis]KGP73836.1 hypothetical protein N782_01370 [Pontibacillus yanchengensis Y32]
MIWSEEGERWEWKIMSSICNGSEQKQFEASIRGMEVSKKRFEASIRGVEASKKWFEASIRGIEASKSGSKRA